MKVKAKNLSKLSNSMGRLKIVLRKNGPKIGAVAGTVGAVGAFVWGCKKSMKVNDIMDEHKETMNNIHEQEEKLNNGEDIPCADGTLYTEEDAKKDKAICYGRTALNLVKNYAGPVTLFAVSLGAVNKSYSTMSKRYAQVASAYAMLNEVLKQERQRVSDRFGEDVANEIKYGTHAKEFEEKVTDSDTGEEKVVSEVVDVIDDTNKYSKFARFYDATCTGWTKNADDNLAFLIQIQNSCNEILKGRYNKTTGKRGWLFLNEVYTQLGMPLTSDGQMFGWIYDEENPVGDNFVDFGIYSTNSWATRRFVNGYEPTVLLDFNIDGNILDLFHDNQWARQS